MKKDITHLTLVDQVGATMDVLRQRHRGFAKETYPSDLHGYFKHRAFRTQQQRIEHYQTLLNIAGAALTGQDITKLVKQAEAQAIIFEAGDWVLHAGKECLVKEVMPDGKFNVVDPAGNSRIVLAKHCQPVPAAVLTVDAATTG